MGWTGNAAVSRPTKRGPGRPSRKLAEAAVLVTAPAMMLAAASADAAREGVSVREWWRRAARVRLGWLEISVNAAE